MRRLTVLTAALAMVGGLGLVAASPAQAACGQMDLYRDPSTYVYLNWSSGSTYTRIEPHGGVLGTRAIISRYQSGIRYYYGSFEINPHSYGDNRSYVSASNGTHAGNFYAQEGDSGVNSLYNDYNYCKPGV
nr:hypothetical protein [Micromonospora sp. DSM 115978]